MNDSLTKLLERQNGRPRVGGISDIWAPISASAAMFAVLLVMIIGLAESLSAGLVHIRDTMDNERLDRIAADSDNDRASRDRHGAADASSTLRHDSLAALVRQNRHETEGKLARLENTQDEMPRAAFRAAGRRTTREIE